LFLLLVIALAALVVWVDSRYAGWFTATVIVACCAMPVGALGRVIWGEVLLAWEAHRPLAVPSRRPVRALEPSPARCALPAAGSPAGECVVIEAAVPGRAEAPPIPNRWPIPGRRVANPLNRARR
jgi:hypothetical protein